MLSNHHIRHAYLAEMEKLAFFGPRTWALAMKFPRLAGGVARGSHAGAQALHAGGTAMPAASMTAAGVSAARAVAAPAIQAADRVIAPTVASVARKSRRAMGKGIPLKRPMGYKNPEMKPLTRLSRLGETVAQAT